MKHKERELFNYEIACESSVETRLAGLHGNVCIFFDQRGVGGGESYDWTQHALQLDARLSYARTLNERTVVRAFGGLQYLHVDAATPTAGVKADSMENLRVELGVGATWMATAKTALNGEVSFIGDMLRDNRPIFCGKRRGELLAECVKIASCSSEQLAV